MRPFFAGTGCAETSASLPFCPLLSGTPDGGGGESFGVCVVSGGGGVCVVSGGGGVCVVSAGGVFWCCLPVSGFPAGVDGCPGSFEAAPFSDPPVATLGTGASSPEPGFLPCKTLAAAGSGSRAKARRSAVSAANRKDPIEIRAKFRRGAGAEGRLQPVRCRVRRRGAGVDRIGRGGGSGGVGIWRPRVDRDLCGLWSWGASVDAGPARGERGGRGGIGSFAGRKRDLEEEAWAAAHPLARRCSGRG